MTTLAQRLARHDRLARTLRSSWFTLAIALLMLGLFWLAWQGWLGQGSEGARQGLGEERGGSGHAQQDSGAAGPFKQKLDNHKPPE